MEGNIQESIFYLDQYHAGFRKIKHGCKWCGASFWKRSKILKAHQLNPKACSNLEECPLQRAVVCKRLLFRFHGLLLSPLALLLSPRPSSLRITAASAAGVI